MLEECFKPASQRACREEYGMEKHKVILGIDNALTVGNGTDDDLTKLVQSEDVADLILFLVTQLLRAHTPEAVIRAPLT